MSSQEANTETARLKKLQGKINRYESHRQFLTECIEKKFTPPGFELKWKMDFDVNAVEEAGIKDILTDTSRALMREGVKVCERILQDINLKFADQTRRLEALLERKALNAKKRELETWSLISSV